MRGCRSGPAQTARWRYLAIVLLASLAVTNRMDLAVLCLPTAVAAMRGVAWRDRVVWGALGAAPFVLRPPALQIDRYRDGREEHELLITLAPG